MKAPTATTGNDICSRGGRMVRLGMSVLVWTACGGNSGSTALVDDEWSHRAVVQGQVVTQGGEPLSGAIVVVRMPPNARHGGYTMPDGTADENGRFRLSVTRVPGNRVEISGVDTVTGYVVAAGGPELADGRLPTDSVPVALHFVPRGAAAIDTAAVMVRVAVP